MLDRQLNDCYPPQIFNRTSMIHIINVIDLQCIDVANQLQKKEILKMTQKMTATSTTCNISAALSAEIIIFQGYPITKHIRFIFTKKTSKEDALKIKNWFEKQLAKRRWIITQIQYQDE